MGGFWFAAAGLTLLALAFLLVPLWRESKRTGIQPRVAQVAALAIVPVSIGLYFLVTTFDAELAEQVPGNEFAMLDQLAARLSANPDDPDGWALLGRSYLQFGDFERARLAFDEAWSRTAEPDDGLKLAYAQTLLFTVPGAAQALAGDIVEEVLAGSPSNEAALFLGGLVAVERSQLELATQRWTALLALNPPPDIADLVRNQLLQLGGLANSPAPPAEAQGPQITVDIEVADSIDLDGFGTGARLYVLARSSAMPAPIAVRQLPLSSLPGRILLSDSDTMLPGQSLAQYDEVSLVARISRSGQPTEQSGDAFAEAIVNPADTGVVHLVIDQLVP